MSPGATFLLKWLAVPIAVAATGYFVVGPRIGGPVAERAAKKIKRSGIAKHIAPATSPPATAGTGTGTSTGDDVIPNPDSNVAPNASPAETSAPTGNARGPQVSVAVTPVNSSRNQPDRAVDSHSADEPDATPRRKRRHRSSTVSTPATAPREKSADPGATEDPAGVGTGVP
jgi:hypothetical protein